MYRCTTLQDKNGSQESEVLLTHDFQGVVKHVQVEPWDRVARSFPIQCGKNVTGNLSHFGLEGLSIYLQARVFPSKTFVLVPLTSKLLKLGLILEIDNSDSDTDNSWEDALLSDEAQQWMFVRRKDRGKNRK